MEHAQILAKLKDMLQERFAINPNEINGQSRRGDMGIDSILMVDLMLDIETELGFTFDTMELPPNPTLDDVCQLISRNLPG